MSEFQMRRGWSRGLLISTAVLSGCAGHRSLDDQAVAHPMEAKKLIGLTLPKAINDRSGWVGDLYAGFTDLKIAPTAENVCAVVAIIEQESSFAVDPIIPGLPAIAWREIDERAAHAGVPRTVVHGILQLPSRRGSSYAERIDRATTEKDLSDVYEDFIAAVPLGETLFADRNPIRTRGPMQVQVVFAEKFAAQHPYPYRVEGGIADELFTRRGGIYFGIAHLLDYPAPYDRNLYRFADFNAGQYASRNAAFQAALGKLSSAALLEDGALLPHDDGAAPGATELALRALSRRLHLDEGAIHAALLKAKTEDFEHTALYQRVFALAEKRTARVLPRAVVPQIQLHGPKISRRLTTAWYAQRVNERSVRCLKLLNE
jgi:hypothetical protein